VIPSSTMKAAAWILMAAACHGGAASGPTLALRTACAEAQYWDGAACQARGDAAARIAAGKQALTNSDVDAARTALDAAERGGPLDHDSNVTLWEQRGIAAAYVDDEPGATAAFDMLLALDPSHILSYRLSPKATFVFEEVRKEMQRTGAPALDINWRHGQKVGDRIPLDLEILADPKRFLRRATVFVRTRGEPSWRAADVTLKKDARLVLPPVTADKPVSLELYLRAYDDKGNEVLAWADPKRPREIPLRYDPPTRWYKRPWVLVSGFSALALATGIIVYAVTVAPPDTVGGGAAVK
jgi:hypothetical protein